MGTSSPQATPGKPLPGRREGGAPFPNLPQKIYSSPTLRQKRAALHTAGGREALGAQVRVSRPFYPSLRRCTWPTSPAGIILARGHS